MVEWGLSCEGDSEDDELGEDYCCDDGGERCYARSSGDLVVRWVRVLLLIWRIAYLFTGREFSEWQKLTVGAP